MNSHNPRPQSARAKTVYFIWKILPRLVLLGMLVLIAVLAVATMKKHDSIAADKAEAVSKERPPVNSVVYPLHPAVIRDRLNLPGTIEAWTDLELLAKVGGYVTEVLVEEGDVVAKGDLLVRIDDNDYRIAVQRAEAAYRLAKADYERDKAVFSKGVIPAAQLDAKETRMLTARADLEEARLQLSRCRITAPIDGVVRRLDAEIGLLVSVGDPVGKILRLDKVKAVVGIPESDISSVRGLDRIEVNIKALDGLTVIGRKHFLAPSPDSLARLYRLELELENPERAILPGMFVRADIVKKTVTDAIVIPFYSVISRGDEQFVFVEENGVARKRPVKLGIMENWLVEVREGLRPDDRLIVEGHRHLEDNRKVEVVKELESLDGYTL